MSCNKGGGGVIIHQPTSLLWDDGTASSHGGIINGFSPPSLTALINYHQPISCNDIISYANKFNM